MNKKKLGVLERAWGAEIACALNEQAYPLIQSKSKLTEELADGGYLERVKIETGSLIVEGYQITHFGILTYCENLPDSGGESELIPVR